jgi:hypothetical protein
MPVPKVVHNVENAMYSPKRLYPRMYPKSSYMPGLGRIVEESNKLLINAVPQLSPFNKMIQAAHVKQPAVSTNLLKTRNSNPPSGPPRGSTVMYNYSSPAGPYSLMSNRPANGKLPRNYSLASWAPKSRKTRKTRKTRKSRK